MRILIAEDERDLNRLITRKLADAGYSVDSFDNGLDAIDALDAVDYDALVLDIMMPGADGYAVLRHLRDQKKATPVLFLTAKDAVSDRVKGLDSGANDYMVKPFAFDELLARIRSMTRASFGATDSLLTVGDLVMNTAAHQVSRAGMPIKLSRLEYSLLEYLMLNKGLVLSRERIEDHVWNFDYEGGTNVVDVYIRYLRKKIDEGADRKLIHTVRGRGYVIREE
ncbi:MAG: response regulator transcription factor [Eubacterium sp.]|nr:response regulator transcription factor [Eubacterium sp.]